MIGYASPYSRCLMWEIDPDNLLAAMERAGLNQSQLAERVGVKQPSIGRLLTGETKTTRALDRIAAALGTTPAYLKGQTSDPTSSVLTTLGPAPSIDAVAAEAGLVAVRNLDLAFGMGATYIDNPVDEEIQLFPESWVRQFSNSPVEFLYFARGVGDSMMPTLHPNDVLLIDASNPRMTMADQIWACNYAGLGMIKRLRPMPDGSVRMLSDNPNVPPETAYDGELNLFGRVVAVVRRL